MGLGHNSKDAPMLNNAAVQAPTPIDIYRRAGGSEPAQAIAEQRSLAAKALDEAHADMRYNRPEVAAAWAAIAEAHLAFARELRQDQ